ncbi:MAG TPA: hypothetical protein VGP05_00050 [Pseudonocardia sp.]|nr:hypothetical protein [Pseudonocardia sp.]
MDERRLTEMFSEAADSAAHNAPPATFDHSDVVAGSRRAQQRSRRLQTSAIAVAVLGLATAGALGVGVLNTSTSGSSTLAEPSPVTSPQAAESAPGVESAPQPFGAQSDSRAAAPFAAGKRAGSSSCAVPDRQLFEQLSDVIPAVRGATPRPLSDEAYCPDGARGVEVDVTDGGARGVLRVLLSPPGSLGGGSNVQTGGSGSTSSVATHDGGSLSLTTSSSRGAAPFEDQLDDLADELAAKN